MKHFNKELSGRLCHVSEQGEGGASVLWVIDENDDPTHVSELMSGLIPNTPFRMIGFSVEDWDRDLTPWEAPGIFKNREFAGYGAETLKWLTSSDVLSFAGDERYIAGYSLAGLFALWSFYETGAFSGAASCSGSLWYPGWREYAKEKAPPIGAKIYLSLGNREEHTKNPIMAAVGDATRELAEILSESDIASKFEWNEGNHFRDADIRLAKGIAWLLTNPLI